MEHHIATGAIFKNKKRFLDRLHEVKGGPVKLKPPKRFMGKWGFLKEKREIWNSILADSEFVEASDAYTLELLVDLMYEARHSPKASIKKAAADMLGRWWDTQRRRKMEGAEGDNDDDDDEF